MPRISDLLSFGELSVLFQVLPQFHAFSVLPNFFFGDVGISVLSSFVFNSDVLEFPSSYRSFLGSIVGSSLKHLFLDFCELAAGFSKVHNSRVSRFPNSRFSSQVNSKVVFEVTGPKDRKIKLAEFSGFATHDRLSYLPLVTVLEKESASQSHGGQPTVLHPALRAAGESGRVSLGSGVQSWFGLTVDLNTFLTLSIPTDFKGGDLDVFLRGEAQQVLRPVSCDFPLTPVFSFA
jgi:hypothetical protein